jgi:hypothetical protein
MKFSEYRELTNVRPAMNPTPQNPVQPSVTVSAERTARTPQEQQAKAEKKERKAARLRFFFAWCEGCQSFGSGF